MIMEGPNNGTFWGGAMTIEEKIHECEKQAMLGDRSAILRLISVGRMRRQSVEKVLANCHPGTGCDVADRLHAEETIFRRYVEELLL
jgi:hypothetical protein